MTNFLKKLKQATIESYQETKQDLQKSKVLQVLSLMLGVFTLTSLNSFADTVTATPVITTEMLKPIVTSVTTNITAILPIGLAIMGAIIGVSMIPRIIYKFL